MKEFDTLPRGFGQDRRLPVSPEDLQLCSYEGDILVIAIDWVTARSLGIYFLRDLYVKVDMSLRMYWRLNVQSGLCKDMHTSSVAHCKLICYRFK